MTKLQAIDDSNRPAHFYLTPGDECYYLYEFTARKGFAYSPSNRFVFNFKKSPALQHEAQYQYKIQAIRKAITIYREIFARYPEICRQSTFVPIPPSKRPDHPEYDDRMWQVVQGVCYNTPGEACQMIRQTANYDAAHLAEDSSPRIKPEQLEKLYEVDGPSP